MNFNRSVCYLLFITYYSLPVMNFLQLSIFFYIPYHVVEPIIGEAARAIDRLDALLGESEGAKANVNFTGETSANPHNVMWV